MYSKGFTLIEVLLSVTLGIFLLASMGNMYILLQKNYSKQESLMLVQENMRIVSMMIMRDFARRCPNVHFKISAYLNGFSICHGRVNYFLENKALYKKEIGHAKTEIIDHVDAMEIKYTVIEQNNYSEKIAEAITDWSLVKGISIAYSLHYSDQIKKGFIYAKAPE